MQELLSSIPVTIFYIIFASQITVFAYYAHKMFKRIKYVADKYPPETHPKLYPNITAEEAKIKVKKAFRFFKIMNIFTILVGLAMIIIAIMTGYKPLGNGEEDFVVLFAMLQFSPLIIIEIGSFKHFKMMRTANSDTTRKAELHRRRFFDYISIPIFSIAILMFLSCLTFELYIGESLLMIITLFIVNIYFLVLILWNLYGKKLDPYQANKDRIKQISLVVKTSVFTSIGVSIFFMINSAVDYFNLDYLDPLIMSAYFQLLAIFGIGTVLRTTKIEEFNFDVYKDNQSVSS